jgi:hypothetical protein
MTQKAVSPGGAVQFPHNPCKPRGSATKSGAITQISPLKRQPPRSRGIAASSLDNASKHILFSPLLMTTTLTGLKNGKKYGLTCRISSRVCWSTPPSSKSTWDASHTSRITRSKTVPCSSSCVRSYFIQTESQNFNDKAIVRSK